MKQLVQLLIVLSLGAVFTGAVNAQDQPFRFAGTSCTTAA